MGSSVLKVVVKGAWVAHLTERPTLNFDSGHDLRVGRFSLLPPPPAYVLAP